MAHQDWEYMVLDAPARLRALREAALSARGASALTDPVARQLELLAEVAAQGAPEAPEVEWWAEGVLERELAAWDEALSRCSSAELGLD